MSKWQEEKLPQKEEIAAILREVLQEYPPLSDAPTDALGTFKAADRYGNIYLVELFGEPTQDDQGRYFYKRNTIKKMTWADAKKDASSFKPVAEYVPDWEQQKKYNV